MEREKIDGPEEPRGLVARAWKHKTERNKARRRAANVVSQRRRKMENRFLTSLYEIWRMLGGTHESSPK